MKKLVGYGFSLPSKPNLFNIGSFDLLGFLFDGRLKPYPTEFYIIEGKEQGLCPIEGDCYHTIINLIFKIKSGFFFMPNIGAMAIAPYRCFNVYLFGFDGVVRGLHPTDIFFMPILLNGALESSTLRVLNE